MKKSLVLVLLGLGIWGYNLLNHNFRESNLHLTRWPASAHSLPHTQAEIKTAKEILKQPFHYLGRGRQSYVFESLDGLYVLKFIKCQRVNFSNFYEKVSLPPFLDKLRRAHIEEKEDRLLRLFRSFYLAEQYLKDDCGLIFMHIQPTCDINHTITVSDRMGRSHKVVIDSVPYVLQRKAQPILPVLRQLLQQGDIDGLKRRLDQLVTLFMRRANQGIINPDNRLLLNNNIGFVADRAIYIDVGTFQRSSKSAQPKYLAYDFKKLKPIHKWLKSHDPELAAYFASQIKKALNATA